MKRILPVVAAVLTAVALFVCSSPAFAYQSKSDARRKTPPSWDKYCHHVFYTAARSPNGWYCRWHPVDDLTVAASASDFQVKILDESNRLIHDDSPLKSSSTLRAYSFNVAGPGFNSNGLPDEDERVGYSCNGTGPCSNPTIAIRPVVQIKTSTSEEWIPMDAESGAISDWTYTDNLSFSFDLAGSIEILEGAEIRIGVRYDQGVSGTTYHGVPQPHYIFTPPIPLQSCFDPDYFADDYKFDGAFTCGLPKISVKYPAPAKAFPARTINTGVVASSTIDSDGDGDSDEDEIAEGSDPDDKYSTVRDRDGDGASNSREEACQSDPDDASSLPTDYDMDCDGICDERDPDNTNGPCGDGSVESLDGLTLETDLTESNEDLYADFFAAYAGGDCSLNPQATTNMTPLWMAFVAALSLIVIRRKK